MDISKLSDLQKSYYLSEVCDLGVYPDLYDPAEMALAWRVLNWARSQSLSSKLTMADFTDAFDAWWAESIWKFPYQSPEAFQTEVLDKILELAIEAGLVEVE